MRICFQTNCWKRYEMSSSNSHLCYHRDSWRWTDPWRREERRECGNQKKSSNTCGDGFNAVENKAEAIKFSQGCKLCALLTKKRYLRKIGDLQEIYEIWKMPEILVRGIQEISHIRGILLINWIKLRSDVKFPIPVCQLSCGIHFQSLLFR